MWWSVCAFDLSLLEQQKQKPSSLTAKTIMFVTALAAPLVIVMAPKFSKQTRGRRCSMCLNMMHEKDLKLHQETCFAAIRCSVTSLPERFIGQNGLEGSFKLVAAGMIPALRTKMLACCKVIKAAYSKNLEHLGCRPADMGHLYGCGWNRRNNQFFGPKGCSQSALQPCQEMLQALLETPALRFVPKGIDNLGDDRPADNELPKVSGFGLFGKRSAFHGENYAAASPSEIAKHLYPRAMQQYMVGGWKGTSCDTSCDTCRKTDHSKCRGCPLHFDEQDASLTILAVWQSSRTPAAQSVRFVGGNESFQCSGGRIFVFHGKYLQHAVIPPRDIQTHLYPWSGLAFVMR